MDLAAEIIRICTDRGVTVATAESCTGGLIGARLVTVPGSSKVLVGGIIAYHNGPKRSLLHVPEETLKEHGAVSEAAVRAMAEGARAALGTTVALAESGIAGPTGGSPTRPAGTVYIGLASPQGSKAERFVFAQPRSEYMDSVVNAALQLLHDWLSAA